MERIVEEFELQDRLVGEPSLVNLLYAVNDSKRLKLTRRFRLGAARYKARLQVSLPFPDVNARLIGWIDRGDEVAIVDGLIDRNLRHNTPNLVWKESSNDNNSAFEIETLSEKVSQQSIGSKIFPDSQSLIYQLFINIFICRCFCGRFSVYYCQTFVCG